MKKVLWIVVLTGILPFRPLCSQDIRGIRYMTEDYPPENYLENGQLKGYAVDILKALWKNMGLAEQPIEVLPWARAYLALKKTPNTMLFATARTPERESLFKWVGPIYSAKYSLIALEERKFTVKSLDDAKALRTGVLNQDVGDRLLQESGFKEASLARATTLAQLIQMLKADRIDLICSNEASLRNEMKADAKLLMRYKTILVVEDIQVYYAFNMSVDDATIDRFRKALVSIDKERQAIIRKYNLTE